METLSQQSHQSSSHSTCLCSPDLPPLPQLSAPLTMPFPSKPLLPWLLTTLLILLSSRPPTSQDPLLAFLSFTYLLYLMVFWDSLLCRLLTFHPLACSQCLYASSIWMLPVSPFLYFAYSSLLKRWPPNGDLFLDVSLVLQQHEPSTYSVSLPCPGY